MNRKIVLLIFLFACKPQQKEMMSVGDNSKVSVDWQGIYSGILPCADCSGIKTEIKLDKQDRYEMVTEYLGKDRGRYRVSGLFKWNADGNRIILWKDQLPDSSQQFQVGENKLWKLDLKGKKIKGDLAQHYVLFKAGTDTVITEKYWKLIELYGKPFRVDSVMNREPYFILHLTDNKVTGNGGCNQFHGEYELKIGSGIRFSRLASTLMACPKLDDERKYLNALETADSYTLRRDTLTLNKARMAPLARFVAVYMR